VEGEVTVNFRVNENGIVEGVSMVPTNISDAAILKAPGSAKKLVSTAEREKLRNHHLSFQIQ
jgi:hypothetical protein